MSDKHDPIALAKGIQWEIAKGHLRAMVAIDGARISQPQNVHEPVRFEEVSEAIESFIKHFEGAGLNE